MKIKKLMLGALSIMAVTSCVNDDILGLGKENSLTGKQTLTVELADIEEGAATRSGFTYTAGKMWQTGDEMRVYDGSIGMFATFTYSAENDIFVAPDNSRIGKENAKYVLFPGDDLSYGGWSETEECLYAVVDMRDEWQYSQWTTEDGVNGYFSKCPIFAAVTEIDDEGHLKSEGRMLAGLLRVRIQNGKGSQIQRIEVESLAKDENAEAKPIAGRFEALLYVDEEGKVLENATLQPTTDDLMATTLKNKITVLTGEDGEKLAERNSYVFVPIVPGTYDKLQVKYYTSTEDENGKVIATLEDVISEANAILYTTNEAGEKEYVSNLSVEFETEEAEVTTPGQIQKILEEAAKKELNMTIDINKTGNSVIKVGDEKYKEEFTTIHVPVLTNDIILNIYSNITSEDNDNKNTLYIDGNGGQGKLTINYLHNGTAADNTIGCDVKVVDYKGNITLAMPYKYAEPGESTQWFADVTALVEGNVELRGNFGVGATVEAEDVTLSGVYAAPVNVTADGKVVVDNYYGYTYNKVSGAVVVEKAETVEIGQTSSGDITVKEGDVDVKGYAYKVAVGKDASLNMADGGWVKNIVTEGGEVTIDAVDKVIETLTFNAPANISLLNGVIDEISKTYDENTSVASVYSEGRSYVNKVENVGNWIEFSSKWDGTWNITDSKVEQSRDNMIYTASQFIVKCRNGLNINTLYTDIDFGNKPLKTISLTSGAGLVGVSRKDGTVSTLKNVNLTVDDYWKDGKEASNVGLFQSSGSKDAVYKNFVIENVTTSFNGVQNVKNMGVLIGLVKTNTEIENVVVKNASVKCNNKSYNIGGLIGQVEKGTVNIVSTTVDADIEGYYNLGGIIGSVAADAEVTFGKTKNKAEEGVKAGSTTIKVVKDMSLDEKDGEAGKVGLAVGELNGKLSLQYFTATWTANDAEKDWKYSKCRFFINDNTMTFKGCRNGNNARYYVGYSPNAQEFKLQETDMVNGYDGETYKANGTFNIFEKLNK